MGEYPSYLIHYGVPGQKWGTRQYQNLDGTWTEEGKRRRRIGDNRDSFSDIEKTGGRPGHIMMTGAKGSFVKSIKKDVDAVNGGERGHRYGYNRQNNCAFCTMSYELRRRGYDVRAQESFQGVATAISHEESAYGKVIPNFKEVSSTARRFSETSIFTGMSKKEYNDMVKTLVSDGNNTRGFISCNWKEGFGGHIFNYEVNNGKLYFIDSQAGTIDNADNSFFNSTLQHAFNIETLRTDNLEIDEEKAKKFYSEDTLSKIKINDLKVSQTAAVAAGAVVSLAAGVAVTAAIASATGSVYLLLPLVVASAGIELTSGIHDIRIANKESKDTERLRKKWDEEGRIKDKWYELDDTNKTTNEIPDAKQSRIKAMAASGKTQEEIAKILGVSLSTVKKYK